MRGNKSKAIPNLIKRKSQQGLRFRDPASIKLQRFDERKVSAEDLAVKKVKSLPHSPKLILTSAIFLIIQLGILGNALAQESVTFQIPKLEKDRKIVVDGRETTGEWKNALSVELQVADGSQVTFQNTKVDLLWDEEFIYLKYNVSDNHIIAAAKKRDDPVYYDDCVEAFFCPIPEIDSLYFGFEMSSRGVLYDFMFFLNFQPGKNVVIPGFNPEGVQLQTAVQQPREKETTGWLHELAIPFAAFDGIGNLNQPKEGSVWKFQLSRWDYQENSKVFTSLTQTGEFSPHVFGKMAYLKFVGEKTK